MLYSYSKNVQSECYIHQIQCSTSDWTILEYKYKNFTQKTLGPELLLMFFIEYKYKNLTQKTLGPELLLMFFSQHQIVRQWPTVYSQNCKKTFTGFVTRLTRQVPLLEQELLTILEHLSSSPVFSGVCFTRSLVLYVCFVDRCLSFVLFLMAIVLSVLLQLQILITSLWYFQSLLTLVSRVFYGVSLYGVFKCRTIYFQAFPDHYKIIY